MMIEFIIQANPKASNIMIFQSVNTEIHKKMYFQTSLSLGAKISKGESELCIGNRIGDDPHTELRNKLKDEWISKFCRVILLIQ